MHIILDVISQLFILIKNLPNYTFHKSLYKYSPSSHTKKYEERRCKAREAAAKRRIHLKLKKRLFVSKISNTQDNSYGSKAEKPDLDLNQYSEKYQEFIKNLALEDNEIKNLEIETRAQRDSAVWHFERRKRLTASYFGQVCHKMPHTSCKNLIKIILYSKIYTVHMKYGRLHESDAAKYISNELKIEVNSCGFFVKKEEPYLGATPDGLIGDDGILEIKCPSSCAKFTPEEAIKEKKFSFFKFDIKNNEIIVNKNNNYFFQVQGQLHVTNRK
ncbi:hypothetical protein AVEN_173228-1 [Araneus ventricosus]|uniref:YqaJ viral recombinase domain-containing protein n=1 Tax=Araneus ventricosus TaxID=182803 RepID=A0A4Y2TC79_ARAVE|nr:hypothetical protein AVEN_173228-1 [Araneus ventricosus]